MSNSTTTLDLQVEEQRLKSLTEAILHEAKQQGATACEVGVSLSAGLSTTVRMGDVETVEFSRDQAFGITVYLGKRQGSASTADSSTNAIKETVKAAYDIARYTSEDPYAGLADIELMADAHLPDLELYHPWDITPEQSIEIAKECEEAGLRHSSKIINSDGATVSSHQECHVYGNSHGFIGSYKASMHSLNAILIGQKGDEMQRDYWYSIARDSRTLETAMAVGQRAAMRTMAMLGSQKIATTKCPVLFAPDMAASLIGHFLAAISGESLYRQSSFLLNGINTQIFPSWMHIHEQPRLVRMLASVNFDGDGLATYDKDFITDGILQNYILSTYTGRRLNMPSTANAGGVSNLFIDSNAGSEHDLLQQMGSGLLVTGLMGQGVNSVTGDYSRGAHGFWVENGDIQYPVSEITIAGNLKDIYRNIVAVGSNVDYRSSIQTGSILVEQMKVAGN